jgi:anti-sigma regulatory factor (Ser/Thr protein kinase)
MGEAREYVRTHLSQILSAPKLADVELMTSELVSNAVQHAPPEGKIGLEIDVGPNAVRVSVTDSGAGFEPAARERVGDIGGWGLVIVDRFSDRWGVQHPPHRVWFEIDR